MNTLLLDLGNSRLKVAWQKEGEVAVLSIAEDLVEALAAVPVAPTQIWLSSVASTQRTQQLQNELAKRWPVVMYQVSVSQYQHYLPTEYATGQLGVDRWLAMLACYRITNQACLVVDCGTAITLDLVNPQGCHLGGYILPGLRLMQDSLLHNTAIPASITGVEGDLSMLPQDTYSAITQGACQAVVALLEKTLMQAPFGTTLLIGGGDAEKIIAQLSMPYTKIDQMVIQGLAQLSTLEHQQNVSGR